MALASGLNSFKVNLKHALLHSFRPGASWSTDIRIECLRMPASAAFSVVEGDSSFTPQSVYLLLEKTNILVPWALRCNLKAAVLCDHVYGRRGRHQQNIPCLTAGPWRAGSRCDGLSIFRT